MFIFNESFKLYDENYKPYGIEIEACNHLWHKHIRPVEQGMAIAACGNKYFLKVPTVKEYSVDYEFSFNYITDFAGATLYSGYERVGHSGYELILKWKKIDKTFEVTLRTLTDDRTECEITKSVPTDFFPAVGELCRAKLTADKSGLTVKSEHAEAIKFEVSVRSGATGFGRPNFIGEIIYQSARFSADLETKTINPPVKVEVPMLEGGTMPLTMEYELYECGEKRYLKATLDGGPQYRENYPYYDPHGTRSQYVVEQWYMTRPYFTYGGEKFYFSMGNINTSDGMHWKGILDVFLGMVDFPVSLTVPVNNTDSNYSFGYEHCWVKGYVMQEGKGEYNFSKDGKYLGKTTFPDTFELRSPEDKYAVGMIEDTVYEAEVVRDHFRRGHFFAEDEEISFAIYTNTEKKYITYKAELRNVFDELMEEFSIDENDRMTHAPLPVGVYRVHLFVYYGGELFRELNVVFEVFDKEGKKCPPLESGLPVLFSTPNEQKYLDRDKFDPWNPGRADNTEHFYALSAFLPYIGDRKRVWEVIKKFGRKWYVWLNQRPYGDRYSCNYKDHLDIVKNADYISYPQDYQWGSLRCDYMSGFCWPSMPELRDLLDKFLDERESEGARDKVGFVRGGEMTQEALDNLYKYYQHEWYDYAGAAIDACFRAQNKAFSEINPKWKRAHYGPINIYATMLRSYPLARTYGFNVSDFLSDELFTGFCQFEDYPASCAYQTLRGPFGVGTFLAKFPRLVIYPEQYKSAIGGCIDGHVKHANPPLGKYDMPLWFNTTLSRDYAYNAAVKTKDGYRFWDTYGFMHADHPEMQDDVFVKDWKYILRHKPKSLMKSPVFFAEFPEHEDYYETEFVPDNLQHAVYNPSEEGLAHLYETARLFGLPMGSFAAWEALDTLTPEDTDLIVLPTTVGLSDERLEKLRELYKNGVSLFATSRIDGLEDLFGVEYSPEEKRMYTLEADGNCEDVYPFSETFNYKSAGANVRMTASGNPVYFTYGRTALLNLPAYSVGRIHFKEHAYLGRATNSDLYYETTARILRELTLPLATSDNKCGITLARDESGNELLLAIDYSRHDQSELNLEREYEITLNKDYTDCVCLDGKPVRKLISRTGRLDGVVVILRQHESAIIKLI